MIVSGLISPRGAPAQLLYRWLGGWFELVVSPALLAEVARALTYPKIAERVRPEETEALLGLMARHADVVADPTTGATVTSADPADQFVIDLAYAARAAVVTGDRGLLALHPRLPVFTPRAFSDLIGD